MKLKTDHSSDVYITIFFKIIILIEKLSDFDL